MKKFFNILYIFIPFILSQIILALYSFGIMLLIRFLAAAGILTGGARQLTLVTEALYYLTGPAIAALLCRAACRRFLDSMAADRSFRPRLQTIAVLFFLGMTIQYALSMALTGISVLFPDAFQAYARRLQELGMTDPTLFSILSGVIIAPFYEEFIFRRLTLSIARKSMPFWAANLFQAAIFGAAHMDLVQGSYAFLLGLLLGYLFWRYRSIIPGILLHFAINLSGFFLVPDSAAAALLLLAACAAGLWAALRAQKRQAPEQSLFR